MFTSLSTQEIIEAKALLNVTEKKIQTQPVVEGAPSPALHNDLDAAGIKVAVGQYAVSKADAYHVWDLSQPAEGPYQWQHRFETFTAALEYAIARHEGRSACLLTREGHLID